MIDINIKSIQKGLELKIANDSIVINDIETLNTLHTKLGLMIKHYHKLYQLYNKYKDFDSMKAKDFIIQKNNKYIFSENISFILGLSTKNSYLTINNLYNLKESNIICDYDGNSEKCDFISSEKYQILLFINWFYQSYVSYFLEQYL